MGFGSYDESEQQNQDVDADENGEGVSIHENEHDGEINFETGASTDDLINKLSDIKDSADNE